MISDHNVIKTILFSESLSDIAQHLRAARKDHFEPTDRIVIVQDENDTYPYIDAAGTKLIEIQKIINSVDISNCFILFATPNPDVKSEIDFITTFYSVDTNPINFLVTEGDYKKEIIKYGNTACRKLWNHLYIGPDNNVNPCCVADHRFPLGNITKDSIESIIHSKKSNQIREWMMQGYRPIACNSCYYKEDRGIQSIREPCDPSVQIMNLTFLDIRINNICNFKCRMCSEYFSSSIQRETIELYGANAVQGHGQISLLQSLGKERNDVFIKIAPYLTNKLQKIYFGGGEPLIAKEHYKILDKLIDIKNTNLQIAYNTNLSQLHYKNLNVLDYWNQFNDITVGASIDASDAVAEYVRHGTIWSDIIKNIFSIKQFAPLVNLKIASTVSFLTIENLIRLQVKWIDDGLFDIKDLSLTVLTTPTYLSPAALPQHHKKRLSETIQQHISWLGDSKLATQWKNVLTFMNNNDYMYSLNDFRHRTRVLDKHRNESFVDVFPEFKDLYV